MNGFEKKENDIHISRNSVDEQLKSFLETDLKDLVKGLDKVTHDQLLEGLVDSVKVTTQKEKEEKLGVLLDIADGIDYGETIDESIESLNREAKKKMLELSVVDGKKFYRDIIREEASLGRKLDNEFVDKIMLEDAISRYSKGSKIIGNGLTYIRQKAK